MTAITLTTEQLNLLLDCLEREKYARYEDSETIDELIDHITIQTEY